jgi:Na+-driven multidrug efflux pump
MHFCQMTIFIPVFLILEIFIPNILALYNLDPMVTKLAVEYIRFTACGVIVSAYGVTYSSWATACGKNQVGMFSTILASIVHLTIVWNIFDKFDNKMTPIAISSMIQFFCRATFSILFTVMDSDMRKAFIPYSDPESRKDLREMYAHGGNTILLRVMSWWAFDVFTQLCSSLPTNYLGGQTILRNIGLFTFMIPAGVSGSANTLIGQQIGKNRVDMA